MIQNFLDALVSGMFKTSRDGRKLFYPRGIWGRGYVIPSENDYQRVARQLRMYIIAAFVLAAVLGGVGYLAIIIGGALFAIFYFVVLVRNLVRGLEPSDERLSLLQAYTSQALAFNTAWLWWIGIGSLVLLAVGIAMLFVEPVDWLTAVGLIALSIISSAFGAGMIFVRRRARNPQTPR
jgi:hypothetical protein